ncbi:iron-containing alcohol dehydrogenase family protein (plasmid) [Cytobacillus spongiae]|uniref:iron-containing alcohol dehydrogenase family protein n=1 Tax=Cytobacillus spongiae TaxID=2901381 RepID=UPI001F31B19D|nr:iron-containing alcohol dehydrogenase family protein [Cytobacillus spongiae]UII58230.1 iron-containing alcohol dehydrogenase family protein [Cytobacillus spongiae]
MSDSVTNVPIPSILEIGSGVTTQLDTIFKKHPFSSAIVLFDTFSYSTLKTTIETSLSYLSIECVMLEDTLDIHGLISSAFSFPPFDVVIAVGGGKVIDYGKYIAFSRRSPFISIPTSPSNDGFASSNCSLIVDGKKTTVPAKVPYGIIVDLDIIKHAPDRFILAGVGDLMSNLTALYDWEYEEKKGIGSINAFAYMLSKKAVNSFIRTPMDDLKNEVFLKELVSSLTMGGISTVISGNSAPISGSEHLISHSLESISETSQMHGIQVGVATYIMAKVQEHRIERIEKVFTRTGFFEYVKTIGLQKADFIEAISMSPSIKPNRYTYLHDDDYRQRALEIVDEDERLRDIFS